MRNENEEKMLEKIVLSQAAVIAWVKRSVEIARNLEETAEEVPDEEAEELPDGSLRIFVPGIPGAELVVPKTEWAWIE